MESNQNTGGDGNQYTGLRSIQIKGSTLGLMNAVVMAGIAGAAGVAHAQGTNTPANSETNAPTKLRDVVVSGQQDSYKADAVEMPRFTEPLRDIPQTITVIPQAVIQEQIG